MNKQIIIFGAGSDGELALTFFGADNVFCFVDNDPMKQGTTLRGKRVFSLKNVMDFYNVSPLCSDIMFEFVVALSGTSRRWAMFSIANQLSKAGISDYSIFHDITKRWKTGADFVSRDREIYPCEQESVFVIYKHQLDYFKRHVSASSLLPAENDLREMQMDKISKAVELFERLKTLDITPIMASGTLLGGVRHGGFIPWDDDLDFLLSPDDFYKLENYFKDKHRLFYLKKTPNVRRYVNDLGKIIPSIDYDEPYLALNNNNKAIQITADIDNNISPILLDFFLLCYYPDNYTNAMFFEDLNKLMKKKKKHNSVFSDYDEPEMPESFYPKLSSRLGWPLEACADLLIDIPDRMRGRLCQPWIFNKTDIYPLQKIKFEGYDLWAPANTHEILSICIGEDYMSLPERVGVYVHDKDRLFWDKY